MERLGTDMRKITLKYVAMVARSNKVIPEPNRIYEVMPDGSLEQVEVEIFIDKIEQKD